MDGRNKARIRKNPMGKLTTKSTASALRQLRFWSDIAGPADNPQPTHNTRMETLATCGLLLLTYFLLAALAG
jgi:hypothetical protein